MQDTNIMVKVLNNFFQTDSFKKSPFTFRDPNYDYISDTLKIAFTIIPKTHKLEKILPEIKKAVEHLTLKKNLNIEKLTILLPIEYDQLIDEYISFLKNKYSPSFAIDVLYRPDYQNFYKQYSYLIAGDQYKIRRLPKFITDIPTGKAYHVHGIDPLLDEMFQKIEENLSKTIVLHNILPGAGKTTAALAFIHKYSTKFNHIAYVLINGDFKICFFNAFYKGKLNFRYNKQLSEEENFYNLINILNKIEGNNLLVVDGITNIKNLANILLLHNKLTWKKLIVSDFIIIGYINIPLPKLATKDTLGIFKFYLKKNRNIEKLKTLSNKLNNHPLLIHFYAKNIVYDKNFTVEKAIELIEKKNKSPQHFGEYLQKNIYQSEQKTINSFLKYISAIYELRQKQWTNLQKKILSFFAAVPLKSFHIETIKQILQIKPQQENEFIDAILDLISQGWLDSDKNGIFTYSLIAVVLHKKLKPNTKKLREYLNFIEKKLNNKDINKALEYIPDAEIVLTTLFDVNIQSSVILEKIAQIYEAMQRPDALAYYRLAADILINIYNENMDDIMAEYIALLYKKAHDYNKSLILANEALEMRKSKVSYPDESLADIHILLAELLYNVKHYHQAYVHAEQAYEILLNFYDENHKKIKTVKQLLENIFNKL